MRRKGGRSRRNPIRGPLTAAPLRPAAEPASTPRRYVRVSCAVAFFRTLPDGQPAAVRAWRRDGSDPAVFGCFERGEKRMAGVAGFEPATYGFGDRRSTN